MLSAETTNLLVLIVLGLHVIIEVIHYVLGFIDSYRTGRILREMQRLLEKEPPCMDILKEIRNGETRRAEERR